MPQESVTRIKEQGPPFAEVRSDQISTYARATPGPAKVGDSSFKASIFHNAPIVFITPVFSPDLRYAPPNCWSSRE